MVSAFLASGGVIWAQGELDAFRYSQPGFNGTARYLSMGGAFGALGGDVSVMNTNPGGLGIYRSSEVVTTISLSSIKSNTDWNGSKADASKTKFNFDNIAYVGYFPTGNDDGLVSWNVGFSYSRVQNFDRSYRMRGAQAYSLADYAAAKASFAGQDNDGAWFGIEQQDMPWDQQDMEPVYQNLPGLWIPGLAYQAGLIGGFSDQAKESYYHSGFGEWDGNQWAAYSPNETSLDVREKGAVDKYNLAFATNFSNILFLGATISITDLSYDMTSVYDEAFGGNDYLYWDSWKETNGTGYALNIGALVRPSDYLRLGVAYNSPTWYKMTDYYGAEAGSYIEGLGDLSGQTPNGSYTDYKLRTPDRWIFSAAAILGQVGLINVDYEMSNYKSMKLSDTNGYEYDDNELIKEDFGVSHAIKVGAEVKVTPQFAIRAGGGWQGTPLKADFKEGKLQVYPAGPIPHYTLYKGTTHYSVGFGYRFTPHFYMDLACIYSERKDDAYTFANGTEVPVDVSTESVTVEGVTSTAASLKQKTTRVALTLGYKF